MEQSLVRTVATFCVLLQTSPFALLRVNKGETKQLPNRDAEHNDFHSRSDVFQYIERWCCHRTSLYVGNGNVAMGGSLFLSVMSYKG